MEETIQEYLHDGKSVKAWKEPGIYIIDFPSVSVRVAEDDIKEVLNDFSKIVKAIKK